MEFISWLTCDTQESIENIYASRDRKTVYWLQPDGKPHIVEKAYEGNGVFGGVYVVDWLVDKNFKEMQKRGVNTRWFGVFIKSYIEGKEGWIYESKIDNSYHAFSDSDILSSMFGINVLSFQGEGNYGSLYRDGMTYSEAIREGVLVACGSSLIQRDEDFISLKFSFNKDASFNQCGKSEICSKQGFLAEQRLCSSSP